MKKRFYDEGVRFECTGCGGCCSNPDGYVQITEDEATAIADYLNIEESEFLSSYTDIEHKVGLYLASNDRGDCVFLAHKRCTIYPVRPLQCRTYPFWPENMKSGYRWKLVAEECPGIGQGRIVAADEIEQLLNLHRKAPSSRNTRNK